MACAESPGIFLHVCSSRSHVCFSFSWARSEPPPRGRDAGRRPVGGDRAGVVLEPAVPSCTASRTTAAQPPRDDSSQNATCANCRTAAGPATATCHESLSASVKCRSSWVECRSASSRCSADTYAIHEAISCVEKRAHQYLKFIREEMFGPPWVEYIDVSEQAWWKGYALSRPDRAHIIGEGEHQRTGAFSRDEGPERCEYQARRDEQV